ncbi:alpha/beta fold hydrolase [Kineococcus gynurae]|uniref:Alpha/beta fold hydrolase n=1 Tax=Kineococcus gynurae TaxID=452979 RepID=A0ABV5LUB4_9ACTN
MPVASSALHDAPTRAVPPARPSADDATHPGPDRPEVELRHGFACRHVGTAGPAAPLLVLVHGLGGASHAWAPVLEELAAGHRLLLVDLPGHGRSPAAAGAAEMAPARLGARLAQLCRDLGEDVHLVGHSLGGWVVLEAAAADGTDGSDGDEGVVRSVTALTPAGLWYRPRPRPPLLPTGQRLARASARLPDWVTASAPVRLLGFATTSAAPLALPLPLLRDAVEAIATATGYADANTAIATGSFTRAADVTCPVTLVSADRDVVIPRAYLRPELAPRQTRFERLRRCGHVPAWDRPADCLRIITATVRSARLRDARRRDARLRAAVRPQAS